MAFSYEAKCYILFYESSCILASCTQKALIKLGSQSGCGVAGEIVLILEPQAPRSFL